MSDHYSFSVPLVPPSVNHYKMPNRRGGWFITKEAQAFVDAVGIFANQASIPRPIAGEFYDVTLNVYQARAKFLRGDSDNMEKVAFDSLTKAGVIRDDRYITRHTHRRIRVDAASQERTEYIIRGIEEP